MSSVLSTESKRGLQTKFQIGSINGPKNFKPHESVFHSSDIPDEKKALKNQTKSSTKKDVLGEDKVGWNKSTYVDEPLCKRQMRILAAYDKPISKYNYRAEVLPKNPEQPPLRQNKFGVTATPGGGTSQAASAGAMIVANRTSEFVVNPKLEGKDAWDHSVEIQKEVWGSKLQKMEETSRQRSEQMKAALVKTGNYTSLETQFKQKRAAEKKERREAERFAAERTGRMEFKTIDVDSPEWLEGARKQLAETDFSAEGSVPLPRHRPQKEKIRLQLNQSSLDLVNRTCKSTRYNFASIGERFGEGHEPQIGDRDEDPAGLVSGLPTRFEEGGWTRKGPATEF